MNIVAIISIISGRFEVIFNTNHWGKKDWTHGDQDKDQAFKDKDLYIYKDQDKLQHKVLDNCRDTYYWKLR